MTFSFLEDKTDKKDGEWVGLYPLSLSFRISDGLLRSFLCLLQTSGSENYPKTLFFNLSSDPGLIQLSMKTET